MTTRYYEERPCEECGRFDLHDMRARGDLHLKPRDGSLYAWTPCGGDGGSRREITPDIEAAFQVMSGDMGRFDKDGKAIEEAVHDIPAGATLFGVMVV